MKYDYLNSTLTFCAIGLFIPGFTAILLLGFQMLLTEIGMECSNSWKLIWSLTWIGMLLLPFLFIKNLKRNINQKSTKTKLIFFNLLEYIFIQASLASFFTSGKTLCYVSDGQNGLELVFTAWLALPILLILSYLFNVLSDN